MKKEFGILFIISLISLSACCKIPNQVNLTLNQISDNVDFHNEKQLRYINSSNYTSTSGIASGIEEISKPNPINFSWSLTSDTGLAPINYVINLREEEGDNIGLLYKSNSTNIDIYNLKINTRYFYSVTACYLNKDFPSRELTFTTSSNFPRNIYTSNVTNFRDIGGKGIKQGLLYRSARLSESDGTTKINNNDIQIMKNELKIKTEIDLRRYDEFGNLTKSVLGNDVNYYHLPMNYGGNNILIYKGTYKENQYDNPYQIKRFFEILSDANNYPINFHCSIGKDRTGCLAYLLGALIGEEEEFLYRDYMFTNFSIISSLCKSSDISNSYGMTLKNYNGETLQEKTYNYLNEVVGISSNILDNVINLIKE